MADSKDNGGSAFPRSRNSMSAGMSLRDWFAGQALVGLINRGFSEFGNAEHAYAQSAYQYADAMLVARGGQGK